MSRALIALCALLLASACAGSESPAPGPTAAASSSPVASPATTGGPCNIGGRDQIIRMSTPPANCIDPSKTYRATVKTARGEFVIKLDQASAPVTVNNFVVLAESHFYDGLTFHRVVPQFVAQGGDPLGNGTGGPAYKLPPEKNNQDWSAGAVGMASSPAGVNGSQFFVVLADAPHLATSGTYNRFGKVESGMDVVLKLAVRDRIDSVVIAAT